MRRIKTDQGIGLIRWIRLNQRLIKLNVDRAARGNLGLVGGEIF